MSGFLPLGNCQPRSFSCVREKGSEIEKEMVGFLFRTYFRLLILDFLLPSFRPSLLSNSLSLVHRPLKFFELCNYKGSSMRIKSKTLSCTPSNFKDKDPQILCAYSAFLTSLENFQSLLSFFSPFSRVIS